MTAYLVFASAISLLAARSEAEPPVSSSSRFASTTGGVMTTEAGAITGELEVRVRPLKTDQVEVAARHAGADNWYVVQGSPIPVEPGRNSALEERIVEHLTTPGPHSIGGNEQAVSLVGFQKET